MLFGHLWDCYKRTEAVPRLSAAVFQVTAPGLQGGNADFQGTLSAETLPTQPWGLAPPPAARAGWGALAAQKPV